MVSIVPGHEIGEALSLPLCRLKKQTVKVLSIPLWLKKRLIQDDEDSRDKMSACSFLKIVQSIEHLTFDELSICVESDWLIQFSDVLRKMREDSFQFNDNRHLKLKRENELKRIRGLEYIKLRDAAKVLMLMVCLRRRDPMWEMTF